METQRMGAVELIIHSAQDLKDVKMIGTMHAYVVASIEKTGLTYSENEDAVKANTPPDRKGGRNPTWEHPLTLPFTCRDLSDLSKSGFLLLQIFATPSSSPTRVGSTLIPFSHITCRVDPFSGQPLCLTDTWQRCTARVQRLSGRYQGFLSFSVRIRLEDGPSSFYPPRSLSSLRSQLGDSTNHIDPTSSSLTFPASDHPSSMYDTGAMAGAFLAGTLAAEAWEMAGGW